jgi:hypothetical protein
MLLQYLVLLDVDMYFEIRIGSAALYSTARLLLPDGRPYHIIAMYRLGTPCGQLSRNPYTDICKLSSLLSN